METAAEGKEIGIAPKIFSEGMLNFISFSLGTTMNSIAKVREFNEKILKGTVEAGRAVQKDAAKKAEQFIAEMKEGRDEYKRVVEENLKILFLLGYRRGIAHNTSDLLFK